MRAPPTHLIAHATLCVMLAACGSGIELLGPDEGSRQSAIVNGQPDSGHPAVGLLESVTTMGYGVCTATLIGSKTVLTAAHCIDGFSSATFKLGGQTYSAAQLIKHPAYTKAVLNANDVALVILGQPVSGIQPVPLARTAPSVGQTVVIVGFGVTSSGLTDSGVKRVTQNTISKVGAQYFTYAGAGGTYGNTCQGDSGGPTFRVDGGKEVLVGVHSTASVPCGYAGNDMRVDQFLTWIEGQAGGDVGPDTDPPSVTIDDPVSGASVAQSFTVRVTAVDSGSGLAAIKLFVDGQLSQSAGASPASFTVSDLAPGQHNLRADVTDKAGNLGSTLTTVTVEPPQATAPGDPPSTPPGTGPGTTSPPVSGAFGASCNASADCDTGLCASDSFTGTAYCTRACDASSPCPSGADCIPAGATQVCALGAASGAGNSAAPTGGDQLLGSCSVGGRAGGLWPALALLLLALVRRRG